MKTKRSERQKQRDAKREQGLIQKAALQESEADVLSVPERKQKKLIAFLERRSLDENLMILRYLAPRVLIAVEGESGMVETRSMTEADGVTISMNGGMMQILVSRGG